MQRKFIAKRNKQRSWLYYILYDFIILVISFPRCSVTNQLQLTFLKGWILTYLQITIQSSISLAPKTVNKIASFSQCLIFTNKALEVGSGFTNTDFQLSQGLIGRSLVNAQAECGRAPQLARLLMGDKSESQEVLLFTQYLL